MNRQNKNQKVQLKENYCDFYISDLPKDIKTRMYEFFAITYTEYYFKSASSRSLLEQTRLDVNFFHKCVINLEPVLLGTTPFSFKKLNRDKYLNKFTRSEKVIAKKAFDLLYGAEIINKKEEEELFASQATVSQILILMWQVVKDFSSMLGFFTKYGLPLLFEALKFCCSMNYKENMNT